MEDYIRNAFKSLESFEVKIDPIKKFSLKEEVEVEAGEQPDLSELTVRDVFNNADAYITTFDFDVDDFKYSLFLEGLNNGDSCDIEFETFDINNITEPLIEILDSEHDFVDRLDSTEEYPLTLDTTMEEVINRAKAAIAGPEEEKVEVEAEETEVEANDREYIKDTVEVEEQPAEESLNESHKIDINDPDAMKEAEEVLNKDEDTEVEKIVDVSAEVIDDLNKTYLGSAILQCPTCKTMIYKDPAKLVRVEGDEELYNNEEECPHCGAKDGFELIGQVASLETDTDAEPVPPVEEEETKVEVEEEKPAEEPHEEEHHEEEVVDIVPAEESKEESKGVEPLEEAKDCEIKLTTEEKNMLDKLTHANKMDAWFAFGDDDETIIDLEDNNKPMDTCEAILTVADGTDDIEQFLNEDEVKLFNDLVARCKECKKPVEEGAELKEEDKKEKDLDENDAPAPEADIKLESFDEAKFDNLVSKYLKETYSNVKEYRTTDAQIDDAANKIILEGKVAFKSGKEKPTKFTFEAKELRADNKLKFVGINEMFSDKRAFTLSGSVKENKLLSEKLSYHYMSGDKKIKGKVESFKKR